MYRRRAFRWVFDFTKNNEKNRCESKDPNLFNFLLLCMQFLSDSGTPSQKNQKTTVCYFLNSKHQKLNPTLRTTLKFTKVVAIGSRVFCTELAARLKTG